MTQDQIDRTEWENPDNWSGALLGIYVSKRDSRVWVPKRRPGLGWTLNLARPAAAWWLVGLITVPPALARLRDRRRP